AYSSRNDRVDRARLRAWPQAWLRSRSPGGDRRADSLRRPRAPGHVALVGAVLLARPWRGRHAGRLGRRGGRGRLAGAALARAPRRLDIDRRASGTGDRQLVDVGAHAIGNGSDAGGDARALAGWTAGAGATTAGLCLGRGGV